MLVMMGGGLGIILRDEMKFKHYNHYAEVHYFDGRHHKTNPCWVFIENLKRLRKE